MQQSNEQTQVIFYTRQFCPLCRAGQSVVAQVCTELQVPWIEIDIDNPPPQYDREALQSQYSDYVPVVTVAGVQQGFWKIDQQHLFQAVSKLK